MTSFFAAWALLAADAVPPFPGTPKPWQGGQRHEFPIAGHTVTVVAPPVPAPGRPWLWHGEFFGHKPEPDRRLLAKGFHIVYVRVPDQFGGPKALAAWDAAYRELTGKFQLAKKSALIGLSRGGLYCYNWAAEHPDRVACLYADAPVCDVNTWPLGRLAVPARPDETAKLLKAYDAADVPALLKKVRNPIDRLEPLAKAKIPLLHVYGDADAPVPWKENTGVIAERYRKLGGTITLIPKPGVGHVHGLDDPTPIVDFIVKHAAGK